MVLFCKRSGSFNCLERLISINLYNYVNCVHILMQLSLLFNPAILASKSTSKLSQDETFCSRSPHRLRPAPVPDAWSRFRRRHRFGSHTALVWQTPTLSRPGHWQIPPESSQIQDLVPAPPRHLSIGLLRTVWRLPTMQRWDHVGICRWIVEAKI